MLGRRRRRRRILDLWLSSAGHSARKPLARAALASPPFPQVIPDAIDCLAPGGRLAVITFHSLEDRIVKWAFRAAAGEQEGAGQRARVTRGWARTRR